MVPCVWSYAGGYASLNGSITMFTAFRVIPRGRPWETKGGESSIQNTSHQSESALIISLKADRANKAEYPKIHYSQG